MKPTISVIIPNYNNAQYLNECIDSVFTQTYQPLECIVVDDGSTDNSLEILNSLAIKHPKLKVLKQINSGPSVARNLGMKHAKGEYFAMLDADDYWSTTKLENQIMVINQVNEEKHIITSQDDRINKDGKVINSNPSNKLPPYTIYDALARNVAIGSCSSVLFPRSLFETTGGYNPVLKSSEDQDFHFRAILNNYQFFHNNEIDVHIRIHPNNSTGSKQTLLFFHLFALELQIDLLLQNGFSLKNQQLKDAINSRIGTITYWANFDKRSDFKNLASIMRKKYLGNEIYIRMFKNTIKTLITRK